MAADLYQIYQWVPLTMVFALGYILYKLFMMENKRDSILYAKFLISANGDKSGGNG